MNWKFNSWRKEWICEHGVGHYDPNYVKNNVHGCDGCCGREDFPGNTFEFQNETKSKAQVSATLDKDIKSEAVKVIKENKLDISKIFEIHLKKIIKKSEDLKKIKELGIIVYGTEKVFYEALNDRMSYFNGRSAIEAILDGDEFLVLKFLKTAYEGDGF